MKIDILTQGNIGHIFVDGREIDGVVKFAMGMEAGRAPVVLLTMAPDAVNVHSDDVKIETQQLKEEKGAVKNGRQSKTRKAEQTRV